MRLKRWIALLVILGFALPLAGCVEDESGEEEVAVDADDDEVVIEEGTEIECRGQTDDHGDETTGTGECELEEA